MSRIASGSAVVLIGSDTTFAFMYQKQGLYLPTFIQVFAADHAEAETLVDEYLRSQVTGTIQGERERILVGTYKIYAEGDQLGYRG